jgi:dipeptidyl aminopeptidase/acylaminoacyl peptidase
MFGEITDSFAQQVSDAASLAYMGTTSPSPELLEILSPTLHISKNTPPTFLWATAGDALVPVQNTTTMATALAQAGVPFELHVFEQGGHGLSLADQSTAGSLPEINADVEKWIGLVDAWLKKRFALSLPQSTDWLAAMESHKDLVK